MAAKRFRLKFTFWLDATKDDEYELVEQIEELKTQRLFSQTLRDGIRLICDLRAGRTEVLFDLFPWLVPELSAPVGAGGDSLLEQQLEELRELILSQNGALDGRLPGLNAMRPSGFSALALDDTDEDDALELEVTETSDSSSAQNFLSSLLNLQQ